ncbi:MAG: response regulator transcription factor [Planctomycetota bacterium]|nr:response regulator transcription factor [Planctomycetaceae bacterium]MDQ3329200.1 response regulator transcription factor [Planctomycetota bacterium]
MIDRGKDGAARHATVLVADDHPLTRRGVLSLIAGEADLTVCGEADTIAKTRRLSRELKPDLVILDLDLPDGDAFDLLEELRSWAERPKVVALAGCSEGDGEAERALRSGAAAFVSRRADGEELLRVLRSALAGHIILGDAVIERLLRQRLMRQRTSGVEKKGDGVHSPVASRLTVR